MSAFVHKSILLEECIQHLCIRPQGVYMDGTLGAGGHAEAVLSRLQGGRLVGFDLDSRALQAAGARLSPFGDAFVAVKSNFKQADEVLRQLQIPALDGILLDLGVSSPQLDDAGRGFSYMQDAPLDMRMDESQPFTAYQVVNEYDQQQLAAVIRDYGEDHFATRIAAEIVRARQKAPIATTVQLARIITEAIPAKFRRSGPHPAKRTFQAIRIEVNGELQNLQQAIGMLISLLNPKGRLCVISFHSLEDRAVKLAMRQAENPCICPRDFPVCMCGRKPLGSVITRKPLLPQEREIADNPRARSAKLRVFEKASAEED